MDEMIKKGILTKTLKKSVFWEVAPCCLFKNYKVSAVYATSFFRVEETIRTLSLRPHHLLNCTLKKGAKTSSGILVQV